MKYKDKEIKDMTCKEAKEFFGEELYNQLMKTTASLGNTCEMNSKGEMVVYDCDWSNMLHEVKTGNPYFFD